MLLRVNSDSFILLDSRVSRGSHLMSSRRRQVVSTKHERKTVIQCMIQQEQITGNDKDIAARAVDSFPNIFQNRAHCGKLGRTHSKKAYWWKTRQVFISKITSPADCRMYVTTNVENICRKGFL